MQHPFIKKELPNYILSGYTKDSPDRIVTTLIKCDTDHLESLVAGNKHWLSLTVFEVPDTPIMDFGREELYNHRTELAKKAESKRRYELFLKLKEEFEPDDKIHSDETSS